MEVERKVESKRLAILKIKTIPIINDFCVGNERFLLDLCANRLSLRTVFCMERINLIFENTKMKKKKRLFITYFMKVLDTF